MAAYGRRRAMEKLTALFILVAFLVVMLVVGIKTGVVCPPAISSCPGPYISTDNPHHAPLDPDVPHIMPVDG
jgi:hypothetical protein